MHHDSFLLPLRRGEGLPPLRRLFFTKFLDGAHANVQRIPERAGFRACQRRADPVGTHLEAHVFRCGIGLLDEHAAILERSRGTGEHQRVTVELDTSSQLRQAPFVDESKKAGILDKGLAMQMCDEVGVNAVRGSRPVRQTMYVHDHRSHWAP
jgi:hypothetical protein